MHLLRAYILSCTVLMVSATVSNSFRDCGVFFYMQTPPAGIRGPSLKKICQKYADKLRYATLYDSSHRLPLYSAYVFKKSDGKRRAETPWMYEPQLVSETESSNMKVLPMMEDISPLIEESQTVLEDYIDAVEYRRFTLNPDQHQSDPDDKSSTYTLTNVVPLITDFVETSWKPYLDAVRRRLNNFCHGRAYIVTGVTVSGTTVRRDNRDRLLIPRHVWMGYCCPTFDRNSPYEVRFMFPSYGGYALNEQTGNNVVEVSIKKLETFLRSQAGVEKDMAVFYKGCMSENSTKKKRRDLPEDELQPV